MLYSTKMTLFVEFDWLLTGNGFLDIDARI